jgi:predicted dienelactone hydrolase
MIQYPLAQGSASQPAPGPFPLLLFAPGYAYCGDTYEHLLDTWVGAGYVVAAVNFPLTDCLAGSALNESDIVNQPADMSYALSKLLGLSGQPGNVLSGLLNQNQIAAAGHSDGGDTVAALGANTCCRDKRLKAVAVLSGSEWPTGWPGQYFSQGAPPMMFTQGNADKINPPSASIGLYKADGANARYYVNLYGADHMTPYVGTSRTEQLVARVTLAFFNRYVLGQTGELATMRQDGNDSGMAALGSGGHVPHGAG